MRQQQPFRVVQIQGNKVVGVAPLFNPFYSISFPLDFFPSTVEVGKLFLIEGVYSEYGHVTNPILISKL